MSASGFNPRICRCFRFRKKGRHLAVRLHSVSRCSQSLNRKECIGPVSVARSDRQLLSVRKGAGFQERGVTRRQR